MLGARFKLLATLFLTIVFATLLTVTPARVNVPLADEVELPRVKEAVPRKSNAAALLAAVLFVLIPQPVAALLNCAIFAEVGTPDGDQLAAVNQAPLAEVGTQTFCPHTFRLLSKTQTISARTCTNFFIMKILNHESKA